jgi:signal transduction histidine kinase
MDRPDRCFSALPTAPPFVAHFDRDDEQILRTIGNLAAVGCQGQNLYASAVLANRHKDEFLAMLGHEMRSPIGAIVAAITTLQSAIVAPAGTTSVLLDILARQIRHLARLVDDLSRIGKGKLDVRLAPVDCGTVVGEAVGIVRPGIERRQQRLEIHITPQPIEVLADATRLTQVFVNLLDNAAKYTPEGGRIHVSVARGDGEACVVVRDTGIGIAPENLGDVFKPFTQLMPAGAHSEGLGLGLALAERLAKLHGGVITASSDGSGKGSAFTVRLPLARLPLASRAPRRQRGDAPSDG